MKAVVCDRYGPPEVLRLEDVERPVPDDDQVLVRVRATTVNRSDCGARSAKPFFSRAFSGLRRPKRRIPGMEFAGEVEAVGSAVTEFAVGDHVFGVRGAGAHAEFTCVKESSPIAHKPAGLSFEEAASLPDGFIIARRLRAEGRPAAGAEHPHLRRLRIDRHRGRAARQALRGGRHRGVHDTKNVELVRSLGADEVIDYLREDFTKNGKTYDVVFDAVGKHSFRRCRRSLKPGGTFIETDLGFMWHVPPLALADEVARRQAGDDPDPDVLEGERAPAQRSWSRPAATAPVIDRTYPLEDVVEATRYVETEQKTGNVVLTV